MTVTVLQRFDPILTTVTVAHCVAEVYDPATLSPNWAYATSPSEGVSFPTARGSGWLYRLMVAVHLLLLQKSSPPRPSLPAPLRDTGAAGGPGSMLPC